MKQLPAQLLTVLNDNEQHYLADCYTFAFADGTKYWTSYDSSIVSGAETFVIGPGIKRGDSRTEAGIKTDMLSLTLYPDTSTVGGLTLVQAATAGLFDGIKVTLKRAYMTTPGDASAGLVTEYEGYVSRIEPSSTEIKLTIQSLVYLLSQPLPRRKASPQCPYRLYGSECSLSPAAFTTTTTVAAGGSALKVRVTATAAADFYKLGTFTVNGVSRSIRTSADLGGGIHELTLSVALPSVPSAGASCTIKRGCDKTVSTCKNTFNNLSNFGGFPYAPRSEGM